MKPSLYLKIKAAKEQGWGTRVTQAAAAWPSLLVCLGQCLENAPKSTLSLTLGCSSSMPKAAAFCRALRVVLTLLLSLASCPAPLPSTTVTQKWGQALLPRCRGKREPACTNAPKPFLRKAQRNSGWCHPGILHPHPPLGWWSWSWTPAATGR